MSETTRRRQVKARKITTNMGLPAFQIIGIVALVSTLLSTTLQMLAFFSPVWWSYINPDSAQTSRKTVGMTNSLECRASSCDSKSLIHIEGEVGEF